MTKNDKKYNFFKMRMSQNSKNVYFSETKAPQGATRHKGAFEKLPPENKFMFLIKSKIDFSPKFVLW